MSDDEILAVSIDYPRCEGPRIRAVQVRLCDVRASDDLRISYDFERDGWKIEQEEIFTDDVFYRGTGNWKEAAFIPAWGFERPTVCEQPVNKVLP